MKKNEEEDNGWDVGENTYEAGEQLADEGCLGCAGGCFFQALFLVMTPIYIFLT
ncbi:hypothetical protein [Cytobacillus sp. BC1816]|uniref:hypothetical protein n=1 Tax=Cytobacillus sp. BC1816 TaxID=3440154 RepID=UPI003F51127E